MKASLLQQVGIGVPITSNKYSLESAGQCNKVNRSSNQGEAGPVLSRLNKFERKAGNFAQEAQDHVRLRPKITDTVKGKLSLGARILQVGGVTKIFEQLFGIKDEEKLLKASQCYLSTTSGPIAGLLFISTGKVAFCSDRSIKIASPKGEPVRVHYKVVIPLEKIKCVNQSKNVRKPSQKYIEIDTVDNFDFWFMGFLNYRRAFKYLQLAVSQS
ncbi:GEM-like protein 4 [Neltuma alba]|uniref:GEM-like protein 4 n=1 Tax=Neltuma alba TaxID=207710 RepID=UPI0010A57240|nr:GEM-like protein 4 [Prosopis alba]